MEYEFTSENNAHMRVVLSDFQLTVIEQGKERIMPYSSITDVRLERKGDCFFTEIRALDFGSVRITCHPFGSSNDNARQYNTFIRVLHCHLLNNKCEAEYWSGVKPSGMIGRILIIGMVSALVYVVEDYFKLLPAHSGIVLLLLPFFALLGVVIWLIVNRAKTYQPDEIPLNMLPAVS